MRWGADMDDPADRPDYCYTDHLIMDEEAERNLRAADEIANERHNLSDLF